MTSDLPQLPVPCQTALAALEADALLLPAPVRLHLLDCPACSEARVLLLALEDAPPVAVPEGYFEDLGLRILRKLPARRTPLKQRATLWLAAALVIAALGVGVTGFFMGRAVRAPLVEASLPKSLPEHPDPQAETPFAEADDPVSQLSSLTPEEAEASLQRLQTAKSEP